MNRFRHLQRALWLALVLVMALVLQACDDNGDEDSSEGEDTSQSQPNTLNQPDILVNHAGQSRLELGQEAPDFTLPAAQGGSITLSDYEGEQPVLLFFHMAVG
jgi:cytochrome oxidase Cu insertion factor (SCO1/SenC/PrrC family)